MTRLSRGRRRRSRAATSRSTASTPASAASPKSAIPAESLAELQVNLLRSHAAGVGDPLPVPVVRATMALRANVLAKGFSGIRLETLDRSSSCSTAASIPSCRRAARSAPAAIWRRSRTSRSCSSAKAKRGTANGAIPGARRACARGLAPVALAPKEGLALINGTQPSTALLGLALHGARSGSRAPPTSPRR